jgi:hypothetical protein
MRTLPYPAIFLFKKRSRKSIQTSRCSPLLLLLFLFVSPIILSGQEKYERESRISVEEVPLAAQEFVNRLPIQKKTKWYLEESLTALSFEAKFKLDQRKYSVEFDTLGQLEDVELLTAAEAISAVSRENINKVLSDSFTRYRIRKVQFQYTGEAEELLTIIAQQTTTEGTTLKFELIVKGKTEEGVHLYEMLFNEEGQLLSQSTIVLKNANNLEY